MFRSSFLLGAFFVLVTTGAFGDDPPPAISDGDSEQATESEAAVLPPLLDVALTSAARMDTYAFRAEAAATPLLAESEDSHSWQPWDGFGTGLRNGFESFPRPIGSPLYFEDPFINSDLRPLFLYHEFPETGLLKGGDLVVQAVQARLALTERTQFIATSDGVADLEAGALPAGEGNNDWAFGLKHAFYVDEDEMAIASAGVRWTLSNGSREVFEGREDEISVFVTGAKAFDKVHLIGDVVGRMTTHGAEGNDSLSWDLNASYKLCKHFYPLLEYHGFVYLSNGSATKGANGALGAKLRDGLLDYGNLGAADVRGSQAHWGTVGMRFNFHEKFSLGAGYGFALRHTKNNDIFDRRITANLIYTF